MRCNGFQRVFQMRGQAITQGLFMQYLPKDVLRMPLAILCSEMRYVLAQLVLKFIQPRESLDLLVTREVQTKSPAVDREAVRQPCQEHQSLRVGHSQVPRPDCFIHLTAPIHPDSERNCRAGRRAPSAPSSLDANKMRTVRRRNDVPAGRRLLVRGTAQSPDAHRCRGMPLSGLPARQDRSPTEARRKKRSVKL